ncbi:MAG TPA: LCP family protein, partial [Anaerolineae bacterium]
MNDKGAPQNGKKQSWRTNLNPIVIIAIVAAVVVFPAVGLMAISVIRTFTDRAQSVGDDASGAQIAPVQIEPWQGTERLNVLLMGIDQRPNDNPDTTRTDTMIILTLDPATHTAGMLSIPRDLYVTIPGRGLDRINAAHVYGGPSLAMKTVENAFGIPIQHFVRVNF